MKMRQKSVLAGFFCLVAVLLFATGAVWAQVEIEGVPKVGGIIIGVAPDYIGSSDYKPVVAPFLRYNLSNTERYFLVRGFEFQFNAVDHPWFRLGPVVNFRGGRGTWRITRLSA